MKTPEEIKTLAKEKYPDKTTAGWLDHWSRSSQKDFIDGYTQCQLDNDYWKQRCLLAEKCLENSPCDPDINSEQIESHKKYNEFIETNGKL